MAESRWTRRDLLGMAGGVAALAQPGPGAQVARRHSITEEMESLKAERGGRTYPAWYAELAEFRKNLRAVIDAEPWRLVPGTEARKIRLLRAAGTPPLFDDMYTLGYVAPEVPDPFAWTQGLLGPEAVRATSRWLKKQNIDLIFAPVPKMCDVYMDRIVSGGVPANKIVSPQVRKLLFELLADDVEVMDLLPNLLKARDLSSDPLYLPADSHWSPAGRAVCVRMLAERIGRYPWAQESARNAAPLLYKSERAKLNFPMSHIPLLNSAEKAEVMPYLHPEYDSISLLDGRPYTNYESGQVLLIGDSYSPMPGPQLAHSLNLPVSMMPIPGGTVQSVKELLRNRSVLKEAKVVVWLVNYASFFLHDWTGLPEIVKREWTERK